MGPDPKTTAAVARAPALTTTALAGSMTPAHPRLVQVVTSSSPSAPAYPGSLWYLLVPLVGSLGSLLSALWLLVGRFMPQRRAELI